MNYWCDEWFKPVFCFVLNFRYLFVFLFASVTHQLDLWEGKNRNRKIHVKLLSKFWKILLFSFVFSSKFITYSGDSGYSGGGYSSGWQSGGGGGGYSGGGPTKIIKVIEEQGNVKYSIIVISFIQFAHRCIWYQYNPYIEQYKSHFRRTINFQLRFFNCTIFKFIF